MVERGRDQAKLRSLSRENALRIVPVISFRVRMRHSISVRYLTERRIPCLNDRFEFSGTTL